MATPSADIMSSPDPLNESGDEASVMPTPSSRRVPRSQRSERFGMRSSSPRKQTFELEVGNNNVPQKLLVTVETEDPTGAALAAGPGATQRRLFQSSSPMPMMRPRETTTTTTVPLREIDEEVATPRRRGRPRKSNGTPMPSAGTKRRSGTPLKRTPRRPRLEPSIESDADIEPPADSEQPTPRRRGRPRLTPSLENDTTPLLEPVTELPTPKRRGRPRLTPSIENNPTPQLKPDSAQPTPKRRGRPPKNRSVEPSSEIGTEPPRSVTSTRGRRRRQALIPEEVAEVVNEAAEEPAPAPAPESEIGNNDENEMTLVFPPASERGEEEPPADTAVASNADADSDIWMATLDDEPTPRAANQSLHLEHAPNSEHSLFDDDAAPADDYGFLAPAPSDLSSLEDEPPSAAQLGNGESTAHGEDFSMIFMDSIHALKSSVRVPEENDYGEETSLIINNTLESLRQSLQKRHDDAEHMLQEEPEQEPEPEQELDAEEDEPEIQEPEMHAPEMETETQGYEMEVDAYEAQVLEPEVEEPEVEEPEAEELDAEEPGANEHEIPDNEVYDIEELGERDEAIESPITTITAAARNETRSPAIRPTTNLSPRRFKLSPRWLLSPRRPGISPLRHQVLTSKTKQPEQHATPAKDSRSPYSETRSAGRGVDEGSALFEDSFSEIPNAVLEAATPRRPTAAAAVPYEDEQEEQDDQAEEQQVEEREDDEPEPENALSFEHNEEDIDLIQISQPDEEMDMDEPAQPVDEVLEMEHASAPLEVVDIEPRPQQDDVLMEHEQPSYPTDEALPTTASVTSGASRSEAGRLPTPDDTPPQIEAQPETQDKSTHTSQASEHASSPAAASLSQSQIVPEIIEDIISEAEAVQEENGAEELQNQRMSIEQQKRLAEVTPVNQISSPLQDPQSLVPLVPESTHDKVFRPLLSPIVRAGRALQSVTSDPPSPEPRENQLRSPFRSSVSRDLGPQAEVEAGRRSSTSPRRPFSFPPLSQMPPAGQAYEDPFGVNTRHSGQASFMEALERSTGNITAELTEQPEESQKGSPSDSMRIAPPSEAEMSWVATEGPISDNLRGDVPLRDLAPSSAIEASKATRLHPQTDEPADEEGDRPVEREDETDIWDFEARRSVSRTTRQEPFGKRSVTSRGRRGTVASPWTRRAPQSPQKTAALLPAEAPSSDADRTVEDMDEDVPQEDQEELAEGQPEFGRAQATAPVEEYSLLSQVEKEPQQDKAPESAARANRFDLSSFFSSPAGIPGMLADTLLPSATRSVFGARPRKPEPEAQPEPVAAPVAMPTSSMFPQVAHEFRPTKSPRRALFSTSRNRAPEPVAEPEPEREVELEVEPEIEPEPTPAPERDSRAWWESSRDANIDPEPAIPHVAQKMNFTPRSQERSQSFFKSTPRVGAPTPPRMQLSRADIQKWQQETSTANEPSSDIAPRPLLRPLPPKNASPTKSSLRSPLKPRTPGRVVEFTSSVLSPIEQARARQQRRLSNSSLSQASVASQSLQHQVQRPVQQQRPPPQTSNKENHTVSDVSMTDASPTAKSPMPEPLSQTVWSRRHWLLLDEMLQRRRHGPYDLGYERRTDKFLGKTVKSQGETMVLERWHLDCVDAFKAEVGGWDEGVLVKRLFALILGEEQRSRGVPAKSSRIMFH